MKENANLFCRAAADRFHFFLVWISIGWALVTTIVYLSLTSSPPEVLEFSSGDKVNHFVAYGALMGWFSQLYSAQKAQALWAVAFILLGVMIEFAQGWSGYRFLM